MQKARTVTGCRVKYFFKIGMLPFQILFVARPSWPLILFKLEAYIIQIKSVEAYSMMQNTHEKILAKLSLLKT